MTRSILKSFIALMVVATAALVGGCGSNSSESVEVGQSTIVIGKVLNPTAMKAGDVIPMAAGDPIEVYVDGSSPLITTRVAADGTFTLRGLPAGEFTLVFMQGTAAPLTEIGRLTFAEVAVNQQITIEISIVDAEIVLVDEDRRGIGHAGIELEGLVQAVLALNVAPSGESRFTIAGRTVIAMPGVTAIRKGTTRLTVNDVLVGLRVHVKGTAVEDSTDILAYEIKIQDDSAGGSEAKITICHIPPGNPDKKKTIEVGQSAWPAHEKHGDTLGPC
jgi:hypothetical protein